jgi:hypothetical protein
MNGVQREDTKYKVQKGNGDHKRKEHSNKNRNTRQRRRKKKKNENKTGDTGTNALVLQRAAKSNRGALNQVHDERQVKQPAATTLVLVELVVWWAWVKKGEENEKKKKRNKDEKTKRRKDEQRLWKLYNSRQKSHTAHSPHIPGLFMLTLSSVPQLSPSSQCIRVTSFTNNGRQAGKHGKLWGRSGDCC